MSDPTRDVVPKSAPDYASTRTEQKCRAIYLKGSHFDDVSKVQRETGCVVSNRKQIAISIRLQFRSAILRS